VLANVAATSVNLSDWETLRGRRANRVSVGCVPRRVERSARTSPDGSKSHRRHLHLRASTRGIDPGGPGTRSQQDRRTHRRLMTPSAAIELAISSSSPA